MFYKQYMGFCSRLKMGASKQLNRLDTSTCLIAPPDYR